MPNCALRSLGCWGLASQRHYALNFITHSDIWMAILMLYLPPQHFYRNNSSVVVTLLGTIGCYLFIALPVFLVETLIGSFSNGNLIRAYDYNRFARAALCINILHQFQNILSGMSNAHHIFTFALTFFMQNMNPHVSLWSCENPWNTKSCCSLLAALNASTDAQKAKCSTPLEEFYKHYGIILYSGVHVPSSGTWDGGLASFVTWMLLAVFIIFIAQLSFQEGIRFVTYLITVPGLLLFVILYIHNFRQPLTGSKVSNLITRRDNFRDEYAFTFFMPNIYHANQMMVAGGYLAVLHCCRKPHRTDKQLKGLLRKNLVLLALCMIAYKAAICILRHGTIGVAYEMRRRLAGLSLSNDFTRETHRDLFEDAKDWLYQVVFEYIESVYAMRNEYNYKHPLLVLDTASMLHPILMAIGFVGVRIVIYKATLGLLFQSLGFRELMSGPWQMLTRVSLPLSILAISLALDNDLCRDYLFPKEPFGYAFCTMNAVIFLPSLVYATLAERFGKLGQSLHWRMMQFAVRYKRRLIIIGLLGGIHFGSQQLYKNGFTDQFIRVLRSNKNTLKTPHIDYFFQHDIGVFGSNAQRVFSYSGPTANWFLNDVLLGLVGCFTCALGLLQSRQVINFFQYNESRLHMLHFKSCRCFKYCLEFYFAAIFGNR